MGRFFCLWLVFSTEEQEAESRSCLLGLLWGEELGSPQVFALQGEE